MKQNTKNVLYFRNLNPHIKHQFKTTCIRRGDTMQDVVEALMRIYIDKPEVANNILREVRNKRAREAAKRKPQ